MPRSKLNWARPKTRAMPKPNKIVAALLVVGPLLLGGCEKPDNAPGPGETSMGEARALERAAEVIEERTVEVADPAGAGDSETQAAPLEVESTAPILADGPAQ